MGKLLGGGGGVAGCGWEDDVTFAMWPLQATVCRKRGTNHTRKVCM